MILLIDNDAYEVEEYTTEYSFIKCTNEYIEEFNKDIDSEVDTLPLVETMEEAKKVWGVFNRRVETRTIGTVNTIQIITEQALRHNVTWKGKGNTAAGNTFTFTVKPLACYNGDIVRTDRTYIYQVHTEVRTGDDVSVKTNIFTVSSLVRNDIRDMIRDLVFDTIVAGKNKCTIKDIIL